MASLKAGGPVRGRSAQTKAIPDDVEQLLTGAPANVRDCALALRKLILNVMPNSIEQVDWSAKLIGYGTDRTYKGLICAIALHKAHVNLMFARGIALPDAKGLLTGTGKKARHVKIEKVEGMDEPAIRDLLRAAIEMHSK